jgi:hypothetical protein
MTTNVLLAGREHHDLGRTPSLVLGVPDKAPRRLANVLWMRGVVANAKYPQPWSPIVRGDGQVLRFPYKNICPLTPGTERAGGFEPTGSQQHGVRDDNGSSPKAVHQVREPINVFQTPQAIDLREGHCGQHISLS